MICSICDEDKVLEAFAKRNDRASGRASACKDCINKKRRKSYVDLCDALVQTDGESTCVVCKETKSAEQYTPRRDGKRNRLCTACSERYKNNWENRNPKYHSKRRYSVLARNRAMIREIKDVPCMDCGQKFPEYVMDFDHVRGIKLAGVSQLSAQHSVEKVLAEIEKCELVCANCHRIRTWNRREEAKNFSSAKV